MRKIGKMKVTGESNGGSEGGKSSPIRAGGT